MRRSRSDNVRLVGRLGMIVTAVAATLVVGAPGPVAGAATYPGCTIGTTTYGLGARGDDVHCIEQALRAKGFQRTYIDTFFGTVTATAVRNFQQANRLTVDGVVGRQTATALGIARTTTPTTTAPSTTAPSTTAPSTTAPSTTAPSTTAPSTTTTTAPTATATYPGCTIAAITYRLGARGDDVHCIEQALRAKGFQRTYIDTFFGTVTATAVRNFQKANRLTVDGTVGRQTATALGIARTTTPTTTAPTTTAPPTTTTAPPTTTTAPPTSPQGTVTIISDSAMAGVRWNRALPGLRGATFVTLLESCRRLVYTSCYGREGYRPRTALAEIERLPTAGANDLLVVATGYNDWESRFSRDVDAIIAAARAKGFRRIAWPNYRTAVSYTLPSSSLQRTANYRTMNAILQVKVNSGSYPELVVWDFDSYTASAQAWFTTDGVHETRLGSWGVADWVSRHVAAEFGRACPMPWTAGGTVESPCPNPDPLAAQRGLPDIRSLYQF